MNPTLTNQFESLCVKESSDAITTTPHILPIYATASYSFDTIQEGIDIFNGVKNGHVYSRYGNPTVDAVSNKIAALESFDLEKSAQAFLTSSGMSAIQTAIGATLSVGDKVLTQGNLYGGSTDLLIKLFSRFGIETIFTDLNNHSQVQAELEQNSKIKMIYLETPTNPTLSCIDIPMIVKLAKANNCLTAIDNTFSTPYLQRPFNYGVDIVIHSTTKYLNGHGNSISGAILCIESIIKYKIWEFLKLGGATSNPFDAWLLNNGMKTLVLRMDKHCSNAMQIAEYLKDHKNVSTVNYPGLLDHATHETAKAQMTKFGGMLSFELEGGIKTGKAFMDKLKHCTMAPTLGDVDTLVLHPASSSHLKVPKEMREANGISDGLIRMSVGIESVEDIINDIEQAIG